jgi:DNA-binding transcriptional MerR regulator
VSEVGETTPARHPGKSAGKSVGKSAGAFRTTTEVAQELDLPAHVLRFWETKFPQVSPLRRAGGRRYYRPEDVELLRRIRQCLYQEGYTIRGVQKLLRQGGLRDLPVAESAREPPPALPEFDEPSASAVPPHSLPTDEALVAALEAVRRELVAIRSLLEKLDRS